MLYFIKKLVDALATPLVLGLILLLLAAAFRWLGRRRTAFMLVISATALVYLCSLRLVSDALLEPLEDAYPPLSDDSAHGPLAGIVVLGSSFNPHDGIPITAAIGTDGLVRVAEGVRLAKRSPGTRLVLSGGVPHEKNRVASAKGYAIFAREMGVDPASMVVLDQSLDTGDEARAVTKLFGRSPFILVTSAYHMKRAMRLMQRAGASPIAAPTGQRAGGPSEFLGVLRPSSAYLSSTDAAIHEYLGLLALSMGQD